MKLHELTPGQRFEFDDWQAGKTFEVIRKTPTEVEFKEDFTSKIRTTHVGRKTFHKDVTTIDAVRSVDLNAADLVTFTNVIEIARQIADEDANEPLRKEINRLFIKVMGLPERPKGGEDE